MSKQGDPIRSYRWQQLRRRVLAEEHTCWICGLALDPLAPPRTRWYPSVDHVLPRAAGGGAYDRANLRAAHVGCNARKKDKAEGQTTGPPGKGQAPPPSPKSRRW